MLYILSKLMRSGPATEALEGISVDFPLLDTECFSEIKSDSIRRH